MTPSHFRIEILPKRDCMEHLAAKELNHREKLLRVPRYSRDWQESVSFAPAGYGTLALSSTGPSCRELVTIGAKPDVCEIRFGN